MRKSIPAQSNGKGQRQRKEASNKNRHLIDQYVRNKYGHHLPEWYSKVNQPYFENTQEQSQTQLTLDAEVLGIRDVEDNANRESNHLRYQVLMNLPDKNDFIAFLESLQSDALYMQCITLFTL